MKDNKSANWSVGCYFVQYSKNSSFHRIIGRSPYRALFGADPKTILKGTNIPDSVISSIQAQIENVEADSAEEKNPEENITNSNNQDIPTSNELTFTPLQFEIEILEDESNIEEVASDYNVPSNTDSTTPAIKILSMQKIESSKTTSLISTINDLTVET